MILKPRPFRKLRKGHWATKNLAGFWPFYEGGGNSVLDLSGNGNVGTLNGTAKFVGGRSGSAVNFDGDSDYISVNDSNSLDVTALTVSCLMRRTASQNGYLIAKLNDHADPGEYSFSLYMSDAEKISLYISDDGNRGSDEETTGTISLNVWHHVVATYILGVYKIYIDGVQVATDGGGAATGAIYKGTGRLTFGARYDSGDPAYKIFHDGDMCNIGIWNRVFSASEIAKLYVNLFCMFERDPIELWSAATLGAPPVGAAGIMTTNTGFWGPTF